MRKLILFFFVFSGLILLNGCSTTKNTGATRAYHGMRVVHNVYFNGRIAYDDGLQAINKSNKDDYSDVIPLYPISNSGSQQAATSEMEKCIEKCRKCIKLHSIHAKPAVDYKRSSDPEYKNWLKSKEFNPQMYRAWLMLAQAEFHKGDFLGSIGTFNYVSRLYENDPDIVAQCQLWVARAYAEMGWIYDAEDMLKKVKPDHLKYSHQPFYSAVSADIHIKAKRYKEAIPFIKVAERGEKRSVYKPRFEYVLGQLYQLTGQRQAAKAAYKRTINMQPEHEMNFQAHLRYYELQGDTLRTMKRLRSMVKKEKNKDKQDVIYGTMGNIYLANKDTAQALRCYEAGIANSKTNGTDKALILVKAGDLYYEQMAYEQAAPCYDEAIQLIGHQHEAYERISKRRDVLTDLVGYVQTIRLQDSLQHLASLSEAEQRKVVEQLIVDLKAQEEADSIRRAEEAREEELNQDPLSVNTDRLIGGQKDNSWYFYNTDLLQKGKRLFRQQWGNRALEDNWRRQSKSVTPNSQEIATDETEAVSTDSLSGDPTAAAAVYDKYQPEYYLQQIPHTEEDIAASNEQIAEALYGLTGLYRDRLEDLQLSRETMEDYERRFPKDEEVIELLYRQYLTALKLDDENEAERCKQLLISRYPQSEQTRIVSNPAYLESLRQMAKEQDSVYVETYEAYRAGMYDIVKTNKEYAETHFPQSYLMPRFMFLNAVGVARTEGQEKFVTSLQEMVSKYPEHELSAMAKSMLAMMGEGQTAQQGGSPTSLEEARKEEQEQTQAEETATAAAEKENTIAIIIAQDDKQLNSLLYEIAVYNFSQFLIRDFDLQAIANYAVGKSAVIISGFEKEEDLLWYLNKLQANEYMAQLLQSLSVQIETN